MLGYDILTIHVYCSFSGSADWGTYEKEEIKRKEGTKWFTVQGKNITKKLMLGYDVLRNDSCFILAQCANIYDTALEFRHTNAVHLTIRVR